MIRHRLLNPAAREHPHSDPESWVKNLRSRSL